MSPRDRCISRVVHGLFKVVASEPFFAEDSSRQRVFRSRSLNFPAPSSALPVTWRVLEGFRRPRLGPLQLRSTSELLPTLRSGLPTFLSWDSLGFRYLPSISAGSSVPDPCRTLPSMSSLASTPASVFPPRLRARRFLAVHLVPTSWFCTTSPDFSAIELRACCISLPIVGFIAFQLICRVRFKNLFHCWRGSRLTTPTGVPAMLPDPSKDFSLSQPIRVTTTVAFLAFSSFNRAFHEITVAGKTVPRLLSRFVAFKAFIRERTLYHRMPYSGAVGLSSLGFFPLQDPSTVGSVCTLPPVDASLLCREFHPV